MPVPADRKNHHVRSEPAMDAGRRTRDRPQIDQRAAGETRQHDFRWDFARGSRISQLPEIDMSDIFLGKGEHDVYLLSRYGNRHGLRSEEHTSELQSLMRISYAVFCLKKKQHIDN